MADILSAMDVAAPYRAVAPGLEGEVLRVLAGTTRGLTGREVARLTGRSSHSGVLAVLNTLSEHGLVDRFELNRAYLFSLNRKHLAAPVVEALVSLRRTFFTQMRETMGRWPIQPHHASLFGSAARGDGDAHSDIDILVVRPAAVPDDDAQWRQQISDFETWALERTGNQPRILERSENELAGLRREQPPLLQELRADAVHLAGISVAELVDGS
jgi:predicted nucleotidyltransferase